MLDDCYAEPILEPDPAIIDAHHHLWLVTEPVLAATAARDSIVAKAVSATFRKHRRYLHDELLSDVRSGHNIRATVFNDARAMYRASGPEELKSVGEVEFVNGIAAMFASGVFGALRACAGIVGGADLRVGEKVEELLTAQIQAGGGRYRGVRHGALYDEDPRFQSGVLPCGVERL